MKDNSRPQVWLAVESPHINHAAFDYYLRLRRVKEYVDQHLTEQLSLTTGAQIAGMEVKYFSRFFREKTGVGFTHWVRYKRIQLSMAMMAERNLSVATVAFAVGFGDLRTFERAFKKYTSVPPIEYKKLVRPA